MKKNNSDTLMTILYCFMAFLAVVAITCGGLAAYGYYRIPIVEAEQQERIAKQQAEQAAMEAEANRQNEQRQQAQAETEQAVEPSMEAVPVAETQPEPENSRPENSSLSVSSNSSGNNSTTLNSDGTYTHDFSGGRLLGTTESDKYHNNDCAGAKKIPPSNEVWFDSIADAEANNYKPCGNCYR